MYSGRTPGVPLSVPPLSIAAECQRSTLAVSGARTAMCAPVVAPAEDGDWLLRFGVHQINPDKNNLPDVLGGNVVLDKDETFTIDAEYMLTRNIGVDLFVPLYTSHDLQLKNTSLGNSANIGETDLFAPILGLNWHFNVDGAIRPYMGVGVNWSDFSRE